MGSEEGILTDCHVPQVRSHAQKYFLKLEKSGKASVVPPPRPKKRAAKPYPVQVRGHSITQRMPADGTRAFQCSCCIIQPCMALAAQKLLLTATGTAARRRRRRGDHSGGEARRRSKRGCHSSPASNSDASLPSTSRGGGAQGRDHQRGLARHALQHAQRGHRCPRRRARRLRALCARPAPRAPPPCSAASRAPALTSKVPCPCFSPHHKASQSWDFFRRTALLTLG